MTDICIVSPSLSGGGAERVAVNLANYFASVSMSVDLVLLITRDDYKNDVSDDVRVVELRKSRVRYSLLSLRKYIRRARPECILSVIRDSNMMVAAACLGLKRKPVLLFREANTLHSVRLSGVVNKSVLMRMSYRMARIVIANSPDTLTDLRVSRIVRENRTETCVIPNPVLPESQLTATDYDMVHPWLRDNGLKVILNVGRLTVNKDQETLIRAFQLVYQQRKDVRLVILGKGEQESKLKGIRRSLGLQDVVAFPGFVPNPVDYYHGSSVFVLTSRWEGFGNVIVEALSAGCPVISTNCPGGPREILGNGKFGKLVGIGDYVRLSKEILETLNSDIERNDLIKRAQDFTVTTVGSRYMKVIQRGIALASSRTP